MSAKVTEELIIGLADALNLLDVLVQECEDQGMLVPQNIFDAAEELNRLLHRAVKEESGHTLYSDSKGSAPLN